MSNHSIIEHRANYHYIKVEEDYVLICSGGKCSPYCKALILAILEHWMNDKRAREQNGYIFMTYPQWIESMYQFFGRNVIINCLAELVKERLILKRPCRLYGKDTFEYILNVSVVQRAIKALPDKPEKATRPNLNGFISKPVLNQTGLEINGTPPDAVYFQTADPFEMGRNIDTITEIHQDIDSERERVFANAPTPTAEMSSEDAYHFAGTEQQHLRWNCRNWCAANHATCEDYVAAIEDGLHERTTDKVPVVPPNVTPVSHSQSSIPDGSMQGEDDGHLSQPAHLDVGNAATLRAMGVTEPGTIDGQVAPIEQTVSGPAAGAVPAHHSGRVARGAAVSAPPGSGPRASEDIPRMAETAAQIRKRVDRRADDLLALYCALMGDKITRSKENMEAMRELAQADRSDEEVTLVMRNILDDPDDFLARQLTPRKLATNFTPRLRTARGNKQTTRSTAQEEPERTYTGFDVYKGNGPEERAALLEYYETHNLEAMFAND